MKILVTGGSGFIGSNFIRYLMKKYDNWHITNLDSLTYAANQKNLETIERDSRYGFIKGDITDLLVVGEVLKQGFDVIVNFAAETGAEWNLLDAAVFTETNVKGVQVLLDASLRYGVKKFVQVSSYKVYGTLKPDDPPFTEESPLSPVSPYAAGKASADLLCGAYFREHGLPVVVARFAENYGLYQHTGKFVPRLIAGAVAGGIVPVSGDGLCARCWIYVEDSCRALEQIMLEALPGSVYNVGGPEEITDIEVAGIVLKILDRPESLIDFVRDRPEPERRCTVDSSRLRKLGWQPEYSLEKGLEETVGWYWENRQWWLGVEVYGGLRELM